MDGPMRANGTRERILATARRLLGKEGPKAVSFDAIARQMGVSKQAVLYWFPSRPDLLAAMFVPWLELESETAEGALAEATTRADAVAAFVRAVGLALSRLQDRETEGEANAATRAQLAALAVQDAEPLPTVTSVEKPTPEGTRIKRTFTATSPGGTRTAEASSYKLVTPEGERAGNVRKHRKEAEAAAAYRARRKAVALR